MTIAFDLDGTLIDSVQDLCAAASDLVTRLGGRPLHPAEVAGMVGDGAAALVARALAAAGLDPDTPDALAQFLERYDRRLLEHTTPYPGIPETLATVGRRARLAVLTNKPIGPSRRILEALDLAQYFDAVIGGDGPHARKPDPAGLRALTDRDGDVALLVGDSHIDWQTARNGGCLFAWARYGFGAARFGDTAPDTPYVLDRPADLVAIVDRVRAVARGA